MIREILIWPNPNLYQKSKNIEDFSPEIFELAKDMIETMYHYNGAGLSAIQVGIPLNLIVLDTGKGPEIFINSRIEKHSDKTLIVEEGCLSVPGIVEKTKRYEWIEVHYLRIDYNEGVPGQCILNTQDTKEFLKCHVIQHELDHVHGKIFIDNLGTVKKDSIKKKIKLQQQSQLSKLPSK